MKRNLFLVLCLTACIALRAQVTPNLWREYVTNPDAHPNIPNCSYAGYRYGDAPIPTEADRTFNVKDYGAKGNNRVDDTEAIRKAIAAAEEAGGGIVYLPSGKYQCSGVLFINSSNVILRGYDREKTIIYFTNSLTSGYAPNYTTNGSAIDQIAWSWAGGMIWITPRSKNTYLDEKPDNFISTWLGANADRYYMAEKEEWNVTEELTAVTSTEERGERSFTVASASGLSAGQYVAIRYANPADWSLMKFFTGDGRFADEYNWGSGTGWISPQNRPYVDWVVQIEKVEGNRVTLMQPLRVPLRAAWTPKIMAIGDLVTESGVENLTIELEKDYESQYDNSNWRNQNHNREKGWNGIYMNNAVNCFVKDVTIYDAEMSAGTAACKNVTFTGVRVYGKDKPRSTHHGFTCRRQSQDILFENFELRKYNQFDHGINVEDFSMGCVWHSGVVIKGCFDTHRLVPAECLRTNIKVEVGGGYGGAGEAGPQIGARFVHWNVELKSGTTNTITPTTTMPMGAIVGVAGDRPSSSPASGCIVEASNLSVAPADLYVGQKQLRNGVVQPEALEVPWTVYDVPAYIEAEDAMINGISIDDDSYDEGSQYYLHSFNNPDRRAEYDIRVAESGRYRFSFRVSSEDKGENYLAVTEKGSELGHVQFNGVGRGNWQTIDADILLNAGTHTIELVGMKGMTCLNNFRVAEATETSSTPFPLFATLPGLYNAYVSVEIVGAEGADIFYRLAGQGDAFLPYTAPIELTETATVEAYAVIGGVESLHTTALYEVTPPTSVPCRILAIDYSDQQGMSIQGITGSNDQLSVGQEGDWAEYVVYAPEAGDYQISTRISIKTKRQVPSTGFEVMVNDVSVKRFEGLLDMGGNWDRFKVYPVRAHFTKGINRIRLVSLGKRFTFDYIEVFKADPMPVPCTIETELYSPESTAYGLQRAVNTGEGRDAGFEVALSAGTRLYYQVQVDKAGNYPAKLIISSKNNASSARLTDADSGTELALFEFSQGSGAAYETTVERTVSLPAGVVTLCLAHVSGGEFYAEKLILGDTDGGTTTGLNGQRALRSITREGASLLRVNGFDGRSFRICTVGGQLLMRGTCSSDEPVDLSTLPAGCHVFSIDGGTAVKILK